MNRAELAEWLAIAPEQVAQRLRSLHIAYHEDSRGELWVSVSDALLSRFGGNGIRPRTDDPRSIS